jgi:hypothetical protein
MEMKTIVRFVGAAAGVALLCGILWQVAQASEPNAPLTPEALLTALAEAGKPGAEHKKLEPLVGRWQFTMKFWADPSQPPVEMHGTVERKWIMDGRFVQETAHGQCAETGKTFEGMGLWGYNAAEKQFTNVRACGLSGTIAAGTISYDPSGKRFECVKEERCPLTGEIVKGRDEVVIESNDRIVSNVYKTIDDHEVKVGEMVTIRQK